MTDDVRWARAPYRGYDLRLPAGEDAELTHVEAGTPGGEYLRRFWTPVAMASQLGAKPVPIRILGEDLVIFRDGSGRIGLLHRHCAHRRASLEFGRIEERGIRCCYHGWHFDVDGTILETPGEPQTSSICKSICQPAYPVREVKGLVFAYMGPPDEMPSFPYLDSIDLPDHELIPYSIHSPCNWLQETENAIDPYHSVFLHGRVNGPQFPGLEHFVELPVVSYHRREAGIVYSHARRVGDLVMLRFHDYLMPNLAQNGGMFQRLEKPTFFGRTSLTKWVVPIDSTNSRKFGWRHFNDKDEVLRQGKRDEVGWETVDFYGQTAHRPYAERQGNPGDWDVWVSQGPVAIHAREYLGKTDEGIAMLRRRLRREIRAVAKGEKIPHVVGDEKNPYPTYGGDTVLRVAKSNDDEAMMRTLQNEVAEIYFAADGLTGEERTARIRADLKAKFPDSAG
ncbi:MAG: Rieske 2Fe-2S domain-containing protein [Proteobacteria bacterium]|nr:Rieske 2Fe-2S domain-containing protein [Pseudomonadota bacterium]